jgi:hypothetical protein
MQVWREKCHVTQQISTPARTACRNQPAPAPFTDSGNARTSAMTKKSEKPAWDKPNPKAPNHSEKLTSSQKASAKKAAKKAGRPYPNMVDNMNAAKKG